MNKPNKTMPQESDRSDREKSPYAPPSVSDLGVFKNLTTTTLDSGIDSICGSCGSGLTVDSVP
jgi:hypothetical protein